MTPRHIEVDTGEGWLRLGDGANEGTIRVFHSAIARIIDAEIARAKAEEREACAKFSEEFMNFTGATYCDVSKPPQDGFPSGMHDYGRGGCDVRNAIARAIRAKS